MRSASLFCGVLACAAACGRIGFGSKQPAGDAQNAPDAFDAPPPSALIHQYSLAGNYADDLGGPSLTGLGGSFVAGAYTFAATQGLSVDGAVPAAAYSIDLSFQLTTVAGYRKVLDFKGLASDAGVYAYDSMLQYVVIPVTGCPGNDCYTSPTLLADATNVEVTITRDVDGTTAGYVNKQLQYTFVDAMAVGAFDAAGGVANFFVDDSVTTGTESSGGIAHRIRIYDRALTAAEVAQLP